MKARRQQVILELVSRERLSSQQEIRARLAKAGIDATQSTISRDVEELGLARIHDQEGVRYVLAGQAMTNGQRQTLRHLLKEFAISMTPSGNMLVITTPPGAANIVAEGLDKTGLSEVAGTVAGDNTIMVVTKEGVPAKKLERELQKLMRENGQ